jgi:hypothetical protein
MHAHRQSKDIPFSVSIISSCIIIQLSLGHSLILIVPPSITHRWNVVELINSSNVFKPCFSPPLSLVIGQCGGSTPFSAGGGCWTNDTDPCSNNWLDIPIWHADCFKFLSMHTTIYKCIILFISSLYLLSSFYLMIRFGVTCDSTNTSVLALNLATTTSACVLFGSIPSSLSSALSSLARLEIAQPLTGSLPSSWSVS